MKKLFIAFTLVFLTASFSNQLLAQTKTCTPAQIEACKKICGPTAVANCTTAQKAACQKVCSKSNEAKVASTNDFKFPFLQVVNTTNEKKASCSPSPSCSKLAKSEAPSGSSKKTKLVKNENQKAAPIAQQVALETSVSNN